MSMSSLPLRTVWYPTSKVYPHSLQVKRMWAPSSVGAIEPVGMTNASTTNARKMNARMNATRIDSSVSFTLLSRTADTGLTGFAGPDGAGGGVGGYCGAGGLRLTPGCV